MKFNLKKEKFNEIEKSFEILKQKHDDQGSLYIIKSSLEDCFNYEFEIKTVNLDNDNRQLFVMSVFPEISTIDKIITSLTNDKSDDIIKKIWENNKKWIIEIDSRILTNDFTNSELTAILLHEIGHIVYSNSIPYKISTILKYEMVKSSMSVKLILKNSIFKKILSLPILNACIADRKRDNVNIKNEVKADEFVKKMGYQKDLISILKKFSSLNNYPKTNDIDENMKTVMKFSNDVVEQFQLRHNKLVKNNLLTLKKECTSPYISNIITEFTDILFKEYENTSVTLEKKMEVLYNNIDKIIDEGYMTEFFLFKKKTLKPIDDKDIDYIYLKIDAIENINDKLVLISYIHSKIDLVDYYLQILKNNKMSNKYNIYQTIPELLDIKKKLLSLRDKVLTKKIEQKNNNILVAWPAGYEG